MKKKHRFLPVIVISLTAVTLLSCGLMDIMGEVTSDATQTAIASQEGTSEDKAVTPEEPEMGTITGQVAYPSEFIPPQRVVAFDAADPEIYYSVELQSGGSYSLEVPAGTYVVLAYLIDPAALGATPGLGAAYSEAVLCGLQYGCDDHSLVPVPVSGGQTVADIDPVDWYLLPGQDAGWPDDPLQAGTGAISGHLGYPSEYIPPLRVVAFDVYSSDFYYVDTEINQGAYQLDGLPVGTYNVVAYVRDQGPEMSAGYSYFVTCGMSVDCSDHSLRDVFVYAGQVTEDVDPIDFYAAPGETDWPVNPTE